MTFDALFASPGGRTSRAQFIAALIVLLAAAAFYYFLTRGRNTEWVLATLLVPGFMLHARRLHDMGKTAWLLLVPGVLCAAAIWLHMFGPKTEIQTFLAGAAVGTCAVFMLWGLIGKGRAEPDRFGAAKAA